MGFVNQTLLGFPEKSKSPNLRLSPHRAQNIKIEKKNCNDFLNQVFHI